ncbi:MAG: VWA domain-containing protein [Deltaproteobacteria bacterium]|nr:VWA domain-containing protein [Deltaproteobacteria bacterium]
MTAQTLKILPALIMTVALVGCSESQLRTVFEEPQFFDQPDTLGPTEWVDEFQQRTVPQSDILFVVDNSCSMSDEQELLASNFDAFIQSFVNTTLDYHIGVVEGDLTPNTPSNWGILREYQGERWIDPDTPNKIDAFNSMADVGDSGDGSCEMGLSASHAALTYQSGIGGPNEGFYREDALLSIIVVTDEPDRYSGGGPFDICGGMTPNEYIPWFLYDLKGPTGGDKLFFTGIIGDRPGGCETSDNSASEGEGYWDVIDNVGGNFLSICSQDWSTFLTELGLEAAGMKRTFYLRRIPKEGTLVVTIDDVVADPSTYAYDRITNSLTFPIEEIPPELSILKATYELVEDVGGSPPVE